MGDPNQLVVAAGPNGVGEATMSREIFDAHWSKHGYTFKGVADSSGAVAEPVPVDAADLQRLRKDELLERAAAAGVEVSEGATKAEIIAALGGGED